MSAAIPLFGLNKFFAIRPVCVVYGHADTGIGIHHLLSGDDFNLIGVGIQFVDAWLPDLFHLRIPEAIQTSSPVHHSSASTCVVCLAFFADT